MNGVVDNHLPPNLEEVMLLIEEKVEIADWEGWRFFCICENKEVADEILAEFNILRLRTRKIKIIKDIKELTG